MKNHRNLIAALFMGVGMGVIAANAAAQSVDCGPRGPMGNWEKYHEQRGERMQQHQKQLHDALKLTPDQEGAWKKFAESVQAPPRPERGDPADWAKLTAPERAEKMLEFSKQRQERMTEHVAALKTFYGVLTPEQKKTFDEFHVGPRGGRHGPGRPGQGQPTMPPPSAPAKG